MSTADTPTSNLEPQADDTLPSGGLLSFYDRLRARIHEAVAARSGKIGPQAADALLLVPDVFMLLARMALDRDVPSAKRALIGSALAYFLLPMDLLPELALGPMGFLDDLVLAVMILSQAFGGDLDAYAEKHWSGPKKLRTVLRDVLETGNSLVGNRVYGRLVGLLESKGIPVER